MNCNRCSTLEMARLGQSDPPSTAAVGSCGLVSLWRTCLFMTLDYRCDDLNAVAVVDIYLSLSVTRPYERV